MLFVVFWASVSPDRLRLSSALRIGSRCKRRGVIGSRRLTSVATLTGSGATGTLPGVLYDDRPPLAVADVRLLITRPFGTDVPGALVFVVVAARGVALGLPFVVAARAGVAGLLFVFVFGVVGVFVLLDGVADFVFVDPLEPLFLAIFFLPIPFDLPVLNIARPVPGWLRVPRIRASYDILVTPIALELFQINLTV